MFLSKFWALVCRYLPDEIYLQWQFQHVYKKKLNFKNPKTYADKLAYLKLNEKKEMLYKLVDKYDVRDFVRNKIGEDYLIPLIGVYDKTKDIPWDEMPQQYVLKCTHDSGSVILHLGEESFDKRKCMKFLNKKLKRNMYYYSREYPYKNIKPRIICEQFLSEKGKPPTDYKFMCFNGKVEYIVVDYDRFNAHKRDIYDVNWNKLNITTDHKQTNIVANKPNELEKMIQVCEELANGFKHVRVDLYYVNNKIYFGEMTFTPWGGVIWFTPDEWNFKFGEFITIEESDKRNELQKIKC